MEPIEKTISHKPKGDAVKQEVDRNEDMIRSTLRAISSLSRIRSSLDSILASIVFSPNILQAFYFHIVPFLKKKHLYYVLQWQRLQYAVQEFDEQDCVYSCTGREVQFGAQ